MNLMNLWSVKEVYTPEECVIALRKSDVTAQLKQQMQEVVIVEPLKLEDVITAVVNNDVNSLLLPSATLTDDEIEVLELWLEDRKKKVKRQGEGIVIVKSLQDSLE